MYADPAAAAAVVVCCALQFMFDFSPREDVPWFDGSLAKLYEYFEQTPEVWTNAAEFMKVW